MPAPTGSMRISVVLVVLVAACGGAPAPQGEADGPAAQATGLVVQEWGTFTSVEAADGHPLGGVHHVDEALPPWVHQRNFTDRSNYYFEQLPEEPLEQLETPVLYFWAPRRMAARVAVRFP